MPDNASDASDMNVGDFPPIEYNEADLFRWAKLLEDNERKSVRELENLYGGFTLLPDGKPRPLTVLSAMADCGVNYLRANARKLFNFAATPQGIVPMNEPARTMHHDMIQAGRAVDENVKKDDVSNAFEEVITRVRQTGETPHTTVDRPKHQIIFRPL